MTAQQFSFSDQETFLQKLMELIQSGVPKEALTVVSPFPVPGVDKVLDSPESKLRFFTLGGAVTGLIFGLAFTILTSLHWPLIGGGKPIVSIPAFIIVAFELTILIGALVSFAGFLILSKLPSIKQITSPHEFGNQFVIIVDGEEGK